MTLRSAVFILLLLLSQTNLLEAAEPKTIPVARAIKILQGLEKTYNNLEWTIESGRGELNVVSDVNSITKPIEFSNKALVRFEPASRRYLVTTENVGKWLKDSTTRVDSAPTISVLDGRGFDGRVHRYWTGEASGPDLQAAKLAPKSGSIMDHEFDGTDFVNVRAAMYAFGFMPPYSYDFDAPPGPLSVRLAALAKIDAPITIVEDDTGVLTVTYQWTKSGGSQPEVFTGRFDATKGGVCLEAQLSGLDVERTVWQRIEFDQTEVSPGLWAPREINLVDVMEKPARLTKHRITNVHINQTLVAKAFVLEFPTGTHIDDHVSGKSYVVTSGPVDEQAAIKEFALVHKLKAKKPAGLWRIRFGIVVGVLVLVGLTVWRWRHLRLMIVLALLTTRAEAAEQIGFTISHHPAEKINISECGFTTTLLALEYHDQPYDLPHILMALQPTPTGIRLADIQDTLTVHGLECQARRNVDAVQLEATVRKGFLAIMPLRLRQGLDHFVVVAMDSTGVPMYIDPPVRVRLLKDVVLDSHQKPHDGLMLFVRRPATAHRVTSKSAVSRKSEALQISVSRDEVDLGSFPMTGPNAEQLLLADVTFSNPTSVPLLVTKVTASCGCTGVSWTGGLLGAKAEQKVSVSTHPAAWGKGMQRRSVTFRFLDGSERSVAIMGEGQLPEQVQQLQINTGTVRFEVGQSERLSRQLPLQSLAVTGPERQLDLLQIVSSEPWLTAKVTKASATARRLEISLNLNDGVIEAVAREPSGVQADLRVSTTSPDNPIRIPIVVACKRFFRISRTLIELEPGTESADSVVFSPIQGEATALVIDGISCDTEGFSFDNSPQNGNASLKVHADADVPTGLHPARCRIKSDLGSERVAEFVIRIRKATNSAKAR